MRTVHIDDEVDLLAHLPETLTAAWVHHGQGLVAVGTAARLTARGPGRFAELSRAFREVAAGADVEDEARGRGSGLVALGSFSYADDSSRESSLVIPRAVLGVSDGEAFFTTIAPAGDALRPRNWRDVFSSTPRAPHTEATVEPDHTPREYQGLVAEAIARIRAGEAGKIVLSETSTAALSEPLVLPALVRALAEAYPTTWVYAVEDVVGASPEMLAQTDGGRVFSRVLAGTRPVADGGELAEDERRAFRSDAKELAEHAFARDSVTRALARVADGVEASPEPFVLRLPGLEHLASDVRATLPAGVTSLDVAAALHPSAAVSGTPREAADAVIARLEAHDRGGYAAPVGWMDAAGNGQWAIALRMAHRLDARTLRLQAGGGIVEGSDPVLEHAEALAKTRPVLSALRALSPRG
ncbi:chorismate-binding protein [Brachybacterium huguangmaarense]